MELGMHIAWYNEKKHSSILKCMRDNAQTLSASKKYKTEPTILNEKFVNRGTGPLLEL